MVAQCTHLLCYNLQFAYAAYALHRKQPVRREERAVCFALVPGIYLERTGPGFRIDASMPKGFTLPKPINRISFLSISHADTCLGSLRDALQVFFDDKKAGVVKQSTVAV